MRVLLLSTSDIKGGAARATYTTHQGLRQVGVQSTMLVANKSSDDRYVIGLQPYRYPKRILRETRFYLDEIALKRYKNKKRCIFSPNITSDNILPEVERTNPDIINMHWICKSFLNPETFVKLNRPIVWTLHDMWGFTGGCHYTDGCNRYIERCGSCPHLASHQENDLSRKLWLRKYKAWKDLDLTIVSISHWLADCIRKSSLFSDKRVEVIPNAINTTKFKPIPKKIARDILNLPSDKNIILFGAVQATEDKRKGFQYVISAMREMARSPIGSHLEVAVFGSAEPRNAPDLGINTTYLGILNDDVTLALAYAAADVMLVPSMEEAFGLTASEALGCGTPVVCFDTTGLKDIVEHQKNGYRASCFSIDDFVSGINWVLSDRERWKKLSQRAREKFEQEFTLDIQAQAYLQLYQEIISKN